MKHTMMATLQKVFHDTGIVPVIAGILITTMVVGGVLYGIFEQPVRVDGNDSSVTAKQVVVGGDKAAPKSQKTDIAKEFTQSNYRVIAVVKDEFGPYSLIVATERSDRMCGTKESPHRCQNDSTCGSIYTSPNCYFFMEPQPSAQADPSTRFVGKWTSSLFGAVDALEVDSLRLVDANNVRFTSTGGDSGMSVRAVWNLNLDTGETSLVSKSES